MPSFHGFQKNNMQWIKENSWLLLFVIWGIPLSYYRSNFRKIVYQTDSWLINIKPIFIKELKGLFGNLYPENSAYINNVIFIDFT